MIYAYNIYNIFSLIGIFYIDHRKEKEKIDNYEIYAYKYNFIQSTLEGKVSK